MNPTSIKPPTTNIENFLIEHGADATLAKNLVEGFYEFPIPPTETAHLTCSPQRYKEISADDTCRNRVAEFILQYVFVPLALKEHPKFITTNHYFGFSLEDKAFYETFLFRHGLQFVVSSLGNCARRASYASLILAHMLPESARIHLVSNPKKDHFVVQLALREKEWHVYDPYTNPERIFSHQDYTRDVLPCYPEKYTHITATNLRVTRQLSDRFFTQLPSLIEKTYALFLTSIPTKETLLQHPITKMYFMQSYPSNTIQLDRALKLVNTLAQKSIELIVSSTPQAVASSSSSGLDKDIQALQI